MGLRIPPGRPRGWHDAYNTKTRCVSNDENSATEMATEIWRTFDSLQQASYLCAQIFLRKGRNSTEPTFQSIWLASDWTPVMLWNQLSLQHFYEERKGSDCATSCSDPASQYLSAQLHLSCINSFRLRKSWRLLDSIPSSFSWGRKFLPLLLGNQERIPIIYVLHPFRRSILSCRPERLRKNKGKGNQQTSLRKPIKLEHLIRICYNFIGILRNKVEFVIAKFFVFLWRENMIYVSVYYLRVIVIMTVLVACGLPWANIQWWST